MTETRITPRRRMPEPDLGVRPLAFLIDPQRGDVEDDASSTKRRSLLGLAGSLLVEMSLPKLAAAWAVLIVLPALLLGVSPLVASAWVSKLSRQIAEPLSGAWPLLLLVVVALAGCIGGWRLFRAAEAGFWSLNSLAVQPAYALCREALRHVAESRRPGMTAPERARLRAATAAGAGVILCVLSLGIAALAWPASRWLGDVGNLASPRWLLVTALANAAVVVSVYLAMASLTWGIADATMDQPHDIGAFDPPPRNGRVWRVAHLSDLHVVGERYGYRIESGRSGPRGNDRLLRVLDELDAIHAARPVDLVIITGDITDAGRSTEWAEFLAALQCHPELAERTLMLPGNHDLNVVDRANPARLDLPTSPGKRLRQLRALSAIAAVQGARVRVVNSRTRLLGDTLSSTLAPYRASMAAFADAGGLRLSSGLGQAWVDAFPMVLPPDCADGLGVVLLNSNADAHFSLTNALGLVSVEQARALAAVVKQFPDARWIVALHHHLVEYPKLAVHFSERIGTALINGTWFTRQLAPLGGRVIVLHGHRHVDWIGECGCLRIVSAPSPVMEATDDEATYFHIHTLAAGEEGGLSLQPPERVKIEGAAARG